MSHRFIWFALFFVVVAASFPLHADLYKKEEPLKIDFSAGPPAKPGTVVQAHLELYIEQGFHAFSNKPEVPGIKPTNVELEHSDQFDVEKIEYPKPEPVYSDIFQRKLGFYQGKVVIPIRIRLKSTASNPVLIQGVLKYQTCSDKVCYPPKSQTFSAAQKITGK